MSDEEFESADAGSDLSKPVSVGSLFNNSYVLIKGFPCKIVDYSTAKTGKHGSAKAMYVGVDIFTGRKYEDSKPTSATTQQPIVVRKDYQLADIDDSDVTDQGSIASLLDPDTGASVDSLRVPNDAEYADLRKTFTDLNGAKDVIVTVLSAMGTSKILPQFVVK